MKKVKLLLIAVFALFSTGIFAQSPPADTYVFTGSVDTDLTNGANWIPRRPTDFEDANNQLAFAADVDITQNIVAASIELASGFQMTVSDGVNIKVTGDFNAIGNVSLGTGNLTVGRDLINENSFNGGSGNINVGRHLTNGKAGTPGNNANFVGDMSRITVGGNLTNTPNTNSTFDAGVYRPIVHGQIIGDVIMPPESIPVSAWSVALAFLLIGSVVFFKARVA